MSSSFPFSTPSIRILHHSPPPSSLAAAASARQQHANDDKFADSAISPVFSSASSSSSFVAGFASHPRVATVPMPIPNARDAAREPVPPPLPPPRNLEPMMRNGEDPGWKWLNGRASTEESNGPTSYSSPPCRSPDSRDSRGNYSDENDSTDRREDARLGFARFQSENHLSIRSHHNSAQKFDRQLLSKLAGPSSRPEAINQPNKKPDFPGALKPLSVPEHRHINADSPGRWHNSPISVTSPASFPLPSPSFESQSQDSFHSPLSRIHHADSYHEDGRRGFQHRNSVEHSFLSDSDHGIDDQGRSLKRRAPSPTQEAPREERMSPFRGDMYHQRRSGPVIRDSPTYRMGPPNSLSSAGSYAQSMSSQMGSSMASSATSYSSERIPGPSFPPHESDGQHFGSPSNLGPAGQEAPSFSSGRNGRLWYTCECCYKKPKRFNTERELRAHENEKQYQCQYCPNRFKNKNEAERHQNSLHLRRYSWSCAALHSPHTAFHPSTMTVPASSTGSPGSPESSSRALPPPNAVPESANGASHDICGYCGKAFPNPPDWDLRSEHLVHEHKFGECNQHKKFYRADHFRQHLKHSHQAGSGKWTNVLENACMKDEPMPLPMMPNRGMGFKGPGMPGPGPTMSPGGIAQTGPKGGLVRVDEMVTD